MSEFFSTEMPPDIQLTHPGHVKVSETSSESNAAHASALVRSAPPSKRRLEDILNLM